MSWFNDIFKAKSFRCGPLSKPTKFTMVCCGHPVDMKIPCKMAEPSVSLTCPRCGKSEWITVKR